MCRVLNICLIFGDIVHLRTWDAGQVGLGQVGCRKGWMQERTDAGKVVCMKGGTPKGGSQGWRDTGKEGS